jgi:large subunit ribosomal protein L24
MHIRVDDTVEVLVGNDRGQRGKVLAVDRTGARVLVEGVNRVYKHVRRSQRNPQGGRLSKEMPISLSNVMLVCRACGKASRMGHRYLDDGRKERFCKRCGGSNGDVSPPKAAYAKK